VFVVNSKWPSACGIIFHAAMVVDDTPFPVRFERAYDRL
jgi:hypothetical protein